MLSLPIFLLFLFNCCYIITGFYTDFEKCIINLNITTVDAKLSVAEQPACHGLSHIVPSINTNANNTFVNYFKEKILIFESRFG